MGAKSGECGGWGRITVLFLAKNSRTSTDVRDGAALSWCKIHNWFFNNSVHFWWFFFFLACEVGFKMPSHLQWPSSAASSGASTKTIPPPFLGILRSRDRYLHYFGKDPEGCPVKDHCLLSHVYVRHILKPASCYCLIFLCIISLYCVKVDLLPAVYTFNKSFHCALLSRFRALHPQCCRVWFHQFALLTCSSGLAIWCNGRMYVQRLCSFPRNKCRQNQSHQSITMR